MTHVWLIVASPLGWSAKKVTRDDGMAALKEAVLAKPKPKRSLRKRVRALLEMLAARWAR